MPALNKFVICIIMLLCLCHKVAEAQNVLIPSSCEADSVQILEAKVRQMKGHLMSAQDSTEYISDLQKLYEFSPYNETYLAWVLEYYDTPAQRHKIEEFIDQQLQNEPNSTMPWILKGEIAMRAKRWEEAVHAYQTVNQIDPNSLPILYNIGLCLSNEAIDMQLGIIENEESLKKEDQQQIKQLFVLAKEYLERVREMDAKRKKVDWVRPLYLVYYALGEKEKANELEPLVYGFKNINQGLVEE